MTTYKQSAVTAKEGINFIRSSVESAGSLFIKIDQENDLGIDALLEFIRGEQPLNKQIAVQIKSGRSYYNPDATECVFPVGAHRQYWENHPLPVFGFVYVPVLKIAYWVNLKGYLKENRAATVVRFPATEANRLDPSSFTRIFIPAVVGTIPTLELDEAFRLARSNKPDERYLGLLVLFRRFPNVLSVWEELITTFVERSADEIPPVLLYWLAHIPGHGDICYYGETVSESTRANVKPIFRRLGYKEVVKLLSFIDSESGIGRGTIGQSVEALVSSLPQAAELLRKIILTDSLDLSIREYSALILAMNEGPQALDDIAPLASAGSWHANEIIRHVREYGGINPYA